MATEASTGNDEQIVNMLIAAIEQHEASLS